MNKTDVDLYFEEQRKDLEYRAEYMLAELGEQLADKIHSLREECKLTQADVAKKLGTKQSRVSEWEDPLYGRYTMLTLAKLADIFDCELKVDLQPKATSAIASWFTFDASVVANYREILDSINLGSMNWSAPTPEPSSGKLIDFPRCPLIEKAISA